MSLRIKPKPNKRSIVDTDISFDENLHLILRQIIEEIESIDDPATQELWSDAVHTFLSTGDIDLLLTACSWRRKVVPIDEFMFSGTYLGMEESHTYPAVIETCIDLDRDRHPEAVLKGAIGTGKTTISNVMLGRGIYKLSCMRHPQTTFGIQSKSSIVFTIQSIRFSTAKKAVFEEFGQYINPSPYFKHIYPYDHKVVSEMIFREQNVRILPVTSSTTGAISMNVIGGILDEMNFMQKIEKSKSSQADDSGSFDQAQQLYNTLARRRKSRFTLRGELPGILFIVSSSRFPDDFTENKARESTMCGGSDDKIYVFSRSQWESKPRSQFLDEEFRVQVGNEMVHSKLLAEGEEPKANCRVIDVPMDFLSEFQKDIDGSLRDYAGITILATHPFILRRDCIYTCMELAEKYGYKNPFNVQEVDLTLGMPKPNTELIRNDVDMFRVCHVDLGLSSDACGIAVGHVCGTKVSLKHTDGDEEPEIEILPVIAIDIIMRVVPPPNGQIEFSQIRKFITNLRDKYKMDIRYVTFDGFQSVDSRQILKKQGFQTDYLSVEKIEPYRAFRDALYEGRVLLPRHSFLAKELAELEVTVTNNKEKVDHRPDSSKDVADAVCGVVSFLLKRRASWSMNSVIAREGTTVFGDPDVVNRIHKSIERQNSNDDSGLALSITDRSDITRRDVSRHDISRRTVVRHK